MIRLSSSSYLSLAKLVVVLLLLSGYNAINGVSAATIDVEWSVMSYDSLTANVGDRIIFTWQGGLDVHNVHINPDMDCNKGAQSVELTREAVETGSGFRSSYTFTTVDAGKDVYFACHVGQHCVAGQHITVSVAAGPEPCTICADGSAITNPNGLVPIAGAGTVECSFIEQFFLPDDEDSEDCQSLRRFGSICGCPIPADACHLCGGTNLVPPSRVNAPLSYLDGSVSGVDFTCGVMEAFLFSTNQGATPECTVPQALHFDYCCVDIANYVPPDPSCSICSDGSPVDAASESPLLGDVVDDFTCSQAEAAADLLVADGSASCATLRAQTGEACCPAPTTSAPTTSAPTTPAPTLAPTTTSPTSAPTKVPTTPTAGTCAGVGGFCNNLFDCCSARCNPLSNKCLPAIPTPKMSLAEGRGGAGGGPRRGGRGGTGRPRRALRVRG